MEFLMAKGLTPVSKIFGQDICTRILFIALVSILMGKREQQKRITTTTKRVKP